MTVYSKQLGAGFPIGAGAHTIYTVPAGKRTILKSVVLWEDTGTAQRVALQVVRSGSAIAQWVYHLAGAGSVGETVNDVLGVVMNAGDSLVVDPIGGNVSVIASGSELTL